MGEIRDLGRAYLRDSVVDGVPASGENYPSKAAGRAVFDKIDEQVTALSSLMTIGVQRKEPVRIAFDTNTSISGLTNGSTHQGVTLETGDRVGVFGQTDSTLNGIRVIQSSGSPTRSTDADSEADILGMLVPVSEGTNAGKLYVCMAEAPITVGTTPLPFVVGLDFSSTLGGTVSGEGLATGGGPVSANPVISVPKATAETATDSTVDDAAVTPYTLDVKVEAEAGKHFTSEEYKAALWLDAYGVPAVAVRHDGTLYADWSTHFTDAEWETAILAQDGTIIAGKKWGDSERWQNGPFYEGADALVDASAYIDSGNAFALTDRPVQITFGEVTPLTIAVDGTDAVYRYVDAGVAHTVREDLLARNSLSGGITKVVHALTCGQSLGVGGASTPAITTSPPSPGRIVMFNGGIRYLGSGQNSADQTTVLPRANVLEWEDAYEQTQGTGGETPLTGLAVRLVEDMPTEAVLITASAIGGMTYNNIKQGTVPYENMLHGIRRAWIMCQLLGLEYEVEIHWIHGEANRNDGLGVYQARLEEFQADVTADVQSIVPGHGEVVLYVSQLANYTAPAYNISFSYVPHDMAQAAIDNPGKIVLVGPRYHLETVSDGIHMTPESSYALGDMHAGARLRHLDNQPPCLMAISAVRTADEIVVKFDVPVEPVVIDTTTVTDPGSDSGAISGLLNGFRYVQTGGTARTISSMSVTDDDEITIVLSGDPGSPSAESLYIALDGVAGSDGGPRSGPRACVRDSHAGEHEYGERYNWLTARILPVTV